MSVLSQCSAIIENMTSRMMQNARQTEGDGQYSIVEGHISALRILQQASRVIFCSSLLPSHQSQLPSC